jgi:hypothetical protein
MRSPTPEQRTCPLCKVVKAIDQFKIAWKRGLREQGCLQCRLERGFKAQELRRARLFRGVDIDAVHRNPRWKKIKEAA